MVPCAIQNSRLLSATFYRRFFADSGENIRRRLFRRFVRSSAAPATEAPSARRFTWIRLSDELSDIRKPRVISRRARLLRVDLTNEFRRARARTHTAHKADTCTPPCGTSRRQMSCEETVTVNQYWSSSQQ